MTSRNLSTAVFLLTLLVSAGACREVVIEREGKKIQLDGFLVEWSEESADTLAAEVPIIWDAMNTPEGVAGYFRAFFGDTCSPLRFSFFPRAGQQPGMTMRLDTADTSSWHAVFLGEDGERGVAVGEWLIPWEQLDIDTSDSYAMGLAVTDACGDTVTSSLTLVGRRKTEEAMESIWTPRLMVQVGIIAVLLILFLVLRGHAQRMKTRNRSDILPPSR